MTHSECVNSALKWVKNKYKLAFSEPSCYSDELPDVIAFNYTGSILIECKVSRADFLKDFKKPFRQDPKKGVGNYRFYCCPKDLIKVDELPENWGLIYVNEKGKARIEHNPYCSNVNGNIWSNGFKIINKDNERNIMFSLLRKAYL